MSNDDYVNWITFFRNLIGAAIVGLLVPYLLYTYIPQEMVNLNLTMMLINGGILMVIYSFYGLFHKDTVIRFLIGCIYIGIIIYFYTVGHSIFTFYLPHCGFGQLCVKGSLSGTRYDIVYNYMYLAIATISLKGLNIFRHLVKPRDAENKLKVAALQKMRLRD